jgi:hypothetical protein
MFLTVFGYTLELPTIDIVDVCVEEVMNDVLLWRLEIVVNVIFGMVENRKYVKVIIAAMIITIAIANGVFN